MLLPISNLDRWIASPHSALRCSLITPRSHFDKDSLMRHPVRFGLCCFVSGFVFCIPPLVLKARAQSAGTPTGGKIDPCSGTHKIADPEPCGPSTPPKNPSAPENGPGGKQISAGNCHNNVDKGHCSGNYFINESYGFFKCQAAAPPIKTENCQPVLQPDPDNPGGPKIKSTSRCGFGGKCVWNADALGCTNVGNYSKFAVQYEDGPNECYVP